MITLYNDFHNTQTKIRKNIGDTISRDHMRRIEARLCGGKDCGCGGIRGDQDVAIESHHTSYGVEFFTIEAKG